MNVHHLRGWLPASMIIGFIIGHVGCVASVESDAGEVDGLEEPALGESGDAIFGGLLATGDMFVSLIGTNGCSGIAIANSWLLTASHCITEAEMANPNSIRIYQSPGFPGGTNVRADWAARSPAFDVALVRTVTPLTINGSTTGYALAPYDGSTADLLEATVTAFGFGPSACNGSYPDNPPGSSQRLRSASLRVTHTWDSSGFHATNSTAPPDPNALCDVANVATPCPDKIRMVSALGGQTPTQGDSGGPILVSQAGQMRLAGTIHTALCGGESQAVSVNGFWPWAQSMMARFEFGSAVAAGDFDRDGRIEVAVGDPLGGPERSGRVYIYGWTSSGTEVLEQTLDQAPGLLEAGDRFGAALVAADFNGDGFSDLAVGLPGEEPGWNGASSGAGYVQIYHGSATGLRFAQSLSGSGPQDNAEQFGSSLAVGDFSDDGKPDLVVGAPFEKVTTTIGQDGLAIPSMTILPGAAFVFHGTGTTATPFQQVAVLRSSDAGDVEWVQDLFGFSLAAGDVSGDGRDDIVVGAPGKRTAGVDYRGSGKAYVYRTTGVTGLSVAGLSQPGLVEEGDTFGYALAVGDFYPGGAADLAVGTPGEAPFGGNVRTGWTYLFTGGGSVPTASGGIGPNDLDSGTAASTLADERDAFFGATLWSGPLAFTWGAPPPTDIAVGVPFDRASATAPRAGRVHLARYSGGGVASYHAFGQQGSDGDETNDYYGSQLVGASGVRYPGDGDQRYLFVGVPGERLGASPRGAVHVTSPGLSSYQLDWIWGP